MFYIAEGQLSHWQRLALASLEKLSVAGLLS